MKAKTPRKPNLRRTILTVDHIKEIVGPTWFHIQQEDGCIQLSTRDNGDVGEERPGKADIVEGRRLLALIQKRCPLDTRHSDFDTVDEWAHLGVNCEPRSQKEIAEIKRKKDAEALLAKVKAFAATINAEHKAKVPDARQTVTVILTDFSRLSLSLHVTWGIRRMYQREGTDFAISTTEEAMAIAGRIREEFADLSWVMSEDNVVESKTANRPPPGNIIERYGAVNLKYDIPR